MEPSVRAVIERVEGVASADGEVDAAAQAAAAVDDDDVSAETSGDAEPGADFDETEAD
jgi:hypothetical protein